MTKEKKDKVNYLVLNDFEEIVKFLISIKEEFTEDIPAFGTRYPGKLESIIAQVEAEYFGKELYPGIVNKAAWMFYCLIKNHPFFNGNKRVAVIALYDFLSINVSVLYIDPATIQKDLFTMAIRTSESKPEEMEKVKAYLRRKIRKFIIRL